jgi:phytoene dehydrogenase-like protein
MSTVAIIGAGMGGLVAGNLLAKKGHKVTIFESHTAPGGYTAGFRKKGYYFESGTVSFESSGAIKKTMQDLGILDKITFSRQIMRWMSPDFDVTIDSVKTLQKALLDAYPDQQDALRRLFSEVDTMWRRLVSLGRPRGFIPSITFPFKILAYAGFFKKYTSMTIPEFCAQYLDTGSPVYRLLSRVGYPNMSAIGLGAALVTIANDYWTVKGGMQSWADVLAKNFQVQGG